MSLDLKGISRSAVAIGFGIAAQLLTPMEYCQVITPDYNPETGQPGGAETKTKINPLLSAFSAKEIDGKEIQFGDEKAMVKATELSGIAPREGDTIKAGGKVRNVIAIRLDATGELYTFHVRTITAA